MTKERKYILIGGAVLLILASIYRFSPQIDGFLETADDIAFKMEQMEKYRKRALKRQAYQTRLLDLNRKLQQLESRLLTGESSSLAAVDIQNILNDIVRRNRLEIDQIQVLRPRKNEDAKMEGYQYEAVPVRISIESTIRQLQNILYGIESHPKILIIKDLQSRVLQSGEKEAIQTTLTVEGYMKVNSKSEKE